jgi:hypothetical protein
LPPNPIAVPIKWRTGSTWSGGPNVRLVSGTVALSASSASLTCFWLTGSKLGTSNVPAAALLNENRVLQLVDT